MDVESRRTAAITATQELLIILASIAFASCVVLALGIWGVPREHWPRFVAGRRTVDEPPNGLSHPARGSFGVDSSGKPRAEPADRRTGRLGRPQDSPGRIAGRTSQVSSGDTFYFIRGEHSNAPDELVTTYAPLVDEINVGDSVMQQYVAMALLLFLD